MRGPLPSRTLAAVACALVVSACGSTVPLAEQQALTAGGDGLSVPTGGATGTPQGTSTPGSLPLGGGLAVGRPGSPTTGPGSPSSLPTVPAGVPGKVGQVLEGKPISVGITYYKDATAGLATLGVDGSLGDQQRYAEILVADINKRGGLHGRPIKPVFFGYDANPGAASIPQQDVTACATFLQDNKVELAITHLAGGALWTCLTKAGVPMVDDSAGGGTSQATIDGNRLLFHLSGFNLDRRAKVLVLQLSSASYFTPWNRTAGAAGGSAKVKVGVVSYDVPDYRSSVAQSLLPALERAGYDAVTSFVAPHDSYDNLSLMATQMSSAILSFKTAGVTHVLVWDDNGVGTLLFMTAAETQGYRPRYGITSGNNMQVVSGLVNAAQLTGAVGMGWVPILDVAAADSDTSAYSSPQRRSCNALMKKNGQSGTSYNELMAQSYCADLLLLERAYAAMPVPSPDALVATLEGLGAGLLSGNAPSNFLGPRQHDGLGGVYRYSYSSGCSCMVYSGKVIPLPHR